MTEDELNAIEARVNAATPGRWEVDYDPDDLHDGPPFPSWYVGFTKAECAMGTYYWLEDSTLMNRQNAEFVAHAREDIPALIAEVRRLQTGLDATGLPWVKWRHSEGPYREA